MKSRNKKRLLALVLCMVVAISNSSFIFASENGQTEYPQEAEVQTQDEAVADDMDVAAYAADEGQAVSDEQPAAVEQVAAEPAAEPETTTENQAAQPVAEAPAAEQPTTEAPAAETPAAQEPAAVPTEETAPTAENATAETPEEDATQAEAENQQLTWSQVVGNTTVNVTAEAGALPADAQLSVTEITAEDEVKEIEKAVEEKAIEEQFSIKNIFSYDIKFLVNGSEVQPTTPVQVSVDTPEITSSENAAVLHVDDNNVAEDMKGAVDEEGKVVFDAPHFSTYVIVQKGEPKVNVTIEYYDDSQSSKPMIYASKKELLPGESISNYDIADNWEFRWAQKITADENTENIQNLDELNNTKITKDCTIKVYYTPKNEPITGSTKFYDYTVKAGEVDGKYHSFNELKNGKSPDTDINNQKLIAGSNDPSPNVPQNYQEYQKYKISLPDSTGAEKDANRYTGGNNTIPKLLKEIDGNGDVIFNYAEPGFFVDEDAYYITSGNEKRYLRKVYWNYTLKFDRSGDTYNLSGVSNGKGGWTSAGDNFYPLEDVKPTYEESETYRNNYFGMRYDVTFKIGDYVGPLNYEFTGDDDLWVVLDGKDIVIDLGGIHQAATKTVNLWEYIKKGANLSDAEKQQNHTLTILYMERGAVASNCRMKFTLPNARIVQVTQEPLANFSFQKVNTNNEALPDAKFSLTNNSDPAKVYEATSDANGTVLFSDLREGAYTLEEIAAPNGYNRSNETWIVKVSKTGGSAVATLYNSDGKTPVPLNNNGVYNIVNQAQQEIIQSSMERSKTATVKEWNDRTYNINIKAASTSTSETTSTQKPVADIMLVLDVSRSMAEKIVTYTYVAMNTEEGRNGLDKNTTYYLESDGKYRSMKYSSGFMFWQSGWYVGTDKAETYSSGCKIYTASTTTRLAALKNSVNQFIDDTKAKSPNSKIGITAFSSEGYSNHGSTKDLTEVGVGDNAQDLKKFVNALNANGGTDPGVGLSKAKEKLDAVANDGKTKCVVLFTDGEPTGNDTNGKWVAQSSAEDAAKKLRNAGYTVYTIGFGLDEKSKTFLAGGTYNGTKYPGIASPGCAKVADDAASLGEIFKEIENTITNDIDIVGATVTDVIDPRFVIVKDDGTPIKNEDLENGNTITLNNRGVVSLDENGNQVVTWTNQTIPNKKKKGEWNNTITVKAKDDYIGGNNVPTNVTPDSKITTGYGEIVLPQPKVNVKAELDIGDKEITIYKGDSLPATDKILQEMFDLSGNVNRYDVSEDDFHITWYDESGNKIDMSSLDAETGGTYHLKVTYDAGAPTTESTANTDKYVAGDRTTHLVPATKKKADGTDERDYGIYTIHVISGEIKLTKELKTALTEKREFVFNVKVTKPDKTVENIEVPITVLAGTTKAMYSGNLLKNLARGTYTITENVPDGYVLTDYAIDNDNQKTNCENSDDAKKESVTFKLGYEKGKTDADVIKNYTYTPSNGGTIGTVSFKNEKATTNWDIVKVSTSSTDVHLQGAEFELQDSKNNIVYTGVSDEDGKIIWKKGNNPVTELEKGTYTLVEKKAPLGYVRSTEKWTITVTKNGSLVEVTTDKTGQEIEKSTISVADATLHLYFKNDVVYDLPSTGHTGIFNILMSGILLMFAGILIIYKMKGKEVLKK